MKKINVEGGGFPGTSRTWRHIAEMIEQNAQLATTIAGNNAIVSGLETSGTSSVTDGLVVLAGEFYPVIGGNVALYNAYLTIKESVDQVQYLKDEDGDGAGDLIDTYFDRYAIVTSVSAGNTKLTDLTRLNTLKELSKRIPPQQTALPYYGSINAIPQGWQLCDGTNGTPNLSGTFVVGYDPNDTDHDEIGSSGGQKEVALNNSQMPQHKHNGNTDTKGSHRHTYKDSYFIESLLNPDYKETFVGNGKKGNSGTDNDNKYIWYRDGQTEYAGNHNHSFTTNNKGGNQPHENRPPYFTMAWITYVGN